jgi:transcription antitermination factor NusG
MSKIEPHPYLKMGERVRIVAGSMAGVEGILVRKKNQFRFILTLDAIMRSVAVEVDADDLEPANPAAAHSAPLVMSSH